MNTSIRTALGLLPLAMLVFTGSGLNPLSVASASDYGRDPPSVRVLIADLDLTKPQGTATLYTRIRSAARSVCGPVDGALLEEKVLWSKCVSDAIGNAVAKVGNANLTNYYLAKTGRGQVITTAHLARPLTIVH